MSGYAPQRQRFPPCVPNLARVGLATASTNAGRETICPACRSRTGARRSATNASTSGWSRSPSIVVTSRPLDGVHERDAGEHRHAVELHRARAAVALAAGDLRAGQPEVLAQRLGERAPDRGVDP
jgi:hypothetical protein